MTLYGVTIETHQKIIDSISSKAVEKTYKDSDSQLLDIVFSIGVGIATCNDISQPLVICYDNKIVAIDKNEYLDIIA